MKINKEELLLSISDKMIVPSPLTPEKLRRTRVSREQISKEKELAIKIEKMIDNFFEKGESNYKQVIHTNYASSILGGWNNIRDSLHILILEYKSLENKK